MRFDTIIFLLFFAAVYLASQPVALRPAILILASIAFYAMAGWRDLGLIAVMVLVNYAASFKIRTWKPMLPLIAAFNIGVLAFFKYRAFLAGGFLPQEIFTSKIIIPAGISFYVFQMTAYQVDLARGHCEQIRSLPRFALFKMFFPQLIAGPIIRARQMMGQIDNLFEGRPRRHRLYAYGLGLCLLGLTKKVIFADSLAPEVDWIFAAGPDDAVTAWLGAWLFAFQIYFDFSGYSDIAVGLSYLLGFRIPVNFRQPYLSRSPREFWQRWHITLSTWIRDYLYIPLGGSRAGGKARQIGVLLFVMAVMGLWHGANWTFIVWGLGWGILIAGGRFFAQQKNTAVTPAKAGAHSFEAHNLLALRSAKAWAPAFAGVTREGFGWLVTFTAALLLWVFFRAPSLNFALHYLNVMAGGGGFGTASYTSGEAFRLWSLALTLLLLQFAEEKLVSRRALFWLKRHNTPLLWGILAGLCAWIVIMPAPLDNPFIYFRF